MSFPGLIVVFQTPRSPIAASRMRTKLQWENAAILATLLAEASGVNRRTAEIPPLVAEQPPLFALNFEFGEKYFAVSWICP